MNNAQPTTFTGSHGSYRWFVTREDDLATLLESCPQSLAGKYVAVTSLDSGPMILTEEEKGLGWHSRNEIAYSPQISLSEDGRLKGMSAGQCAGYDEWYVFDSPHDLGAVCDGNVFESDLPAGKIWTFVNYDAGFALHNPEMSALPAFSGSNLSGFNLNPCSCARQQLESAVVVLVAHISRETENLCTILVHGFANPIRAGATALAQAQSRPAAPARLYPRQ